MRAHELTGLIGRVVTLETLAGITATGIVAGTRDPDDWKDAGSSAHLIFTDGIEIQIDERTRLRISVPDATTASKSLVTLKDDWARDEENGTSE